MLPEIKIHALLNQNSLFADHHRVWLSCHRCQRLDDLHVNADPAHKHIFGEKFVVVVKQNLSNHSKNINNVRWKRTQLEGLAAIFVRQHTNTSIHTYALPHTFTDRQIHIHTHKHYYILSQKYTQISTHTAINTHHTHIHKYTQHTRTHKHTHRHSNTHTYDVINAQTHTRIHTQTHAQIITYTFFLFLFWCAPVVSSSQHGDRDLTCKCPRERLPRIIRLN